MTKKYRIEYDRDACIGAATCTIYSKRFKMAKDGKADFKGSKKKDGIFVLEVDEKEIDDIIESARSCPENVIHVFDGDKKLV